jgi:hypothetical protein
MSDPQMMVSLIAIAGHGGGKIQLPMAAATNGSIGPKPKIRLSVGIRGLFGRGIRPQRIGERVVALAAQATDFESFGPSITAKRYAADPSAESMMDTPETNISTEHQPKGAALNPSDTLDREKENVAPGQRQWNADSQQDPDTKPTDSARPAGMADEGATSEEMSSPSPDANTRTAERGEDQAEDGYADDGARSEG